MTRSDDGVADPARSASSGPPGASVNLVPGVSAAPSSLIEPGTSSRFRAVVAEALPARTVLRWALEAVFAAGVLFLVVLTGGACLIALGIH